MRSITYSYNNNDISCPVWNGIANYWEMNNNSSYSQINNYIGLTDLIYSTTSTTSSDGSKNFYYFNGSNYLYNNSVIALKSDSLIPLNSDFTLSFWLNLNNATLNADIPIFGNLAGQTFNWPKTYNTSFAGPVSGISITYNTPDSNNYTLKCFTRSASYNFPNVNLSLNSWNHFVFTGKNNTLNFYLNGSNIGSINVGMTKQPIAFGVNDFFSTGRVYLSNAWISDISFFSRVLTPQEINKLYNRNNTLILNSPTLVDIKYLMVGGGAGVSYISTQNGAGGGGAGGAVYGTVIANANNHYFINVGGGGSGGYNGNDSYIQQKDTYGNNIPSLFDSLTGLGGGAGSGTGYTPNTGGCGGGARRDNGKTGGIGIQGGNGGSELLTGYSSAGGGGGMGGNGYNGANDGSPYGGGTNYYPDPVSRGGIGMINPILGSTTGGVLSAGNYWICGGGAGAFFNGGITDTVHFPKGGLGGGGDGASANGTSPTQKSGMPNTGGGGGDCIRSGSNGGSGVVVISIPNQFYKGDISITSDIQGTNPLASSSTTWQKSVSGERTIIEFYSSANIYL